MLLLLKYVQGGEEVIIGSAERWIVIYHTSYKRKGGVTRVIPGTSIQRV